MSPVRLIIWMAVLLFAVSSLDAASSGHGGTAQAFKLNRQEVQLKRWVEAHTEAQIRDLETVVNINSGTTNTEGVRQVGTFFAKELKALGFDVRWIDMPPQMHRAGHLVARRTGGRGKRLLLIGHLDTVFPKESPFQRFERAGDRIAGPGVDDMKDGNLVILYALRALHRFGALDGANITVVLMGDEEFPGSPTEVSRAELIKLARQSDIALGFESGYDQTATIGRRGALGWSLKVRGKRAHSATILGAETGAGASFELARVLEDVRKRFAGDPTLTINPAVILAGTSTEFDDLEFRGSASGKVNIVADNAFAAGDIRYSTPEQSEWAKQEFRSALGGSLMHTSATVEFHEFYPAMVPTAGNLALHLMYSDISESIGAGAVKKNDPARTGAADISFVAKYVDCLDGLGGWGGANHTTEEFLDARSLAIATTRAAIMILRLTRTEIR